MRFEKFTEKKFIQSVHWPSSLVVLMGLVLVNAVVKGWYLGLNSLANDEPFSVYHAQMDVGSIVRLLSTGNNPPLYEIVLHYWIQIFGISEISVRFPSLIFSCISVVFMFKIGKDFFNRRVAVMASFVFIFSNYHIALTHESRVYALLGCLALISMYLYLGLHRRAEIGESAVDYSAFFVLGLVNTLLIYAHYFGFMFLLVQAIHAAMRHRIFRPYWKGVLIAVITMLLLYLPNIPILLHRFSESAHGTWIPKPSFSSLYFMVVVFSNVPLMAVLFLLISMGWAFRRLLIVRNSSPVNLKSTFSKAGMGSKSSLQLLMMWFWGILLVMFAVSFTTPMFFERYLMVSAISFPLVLAVSIEHVIQHRILQMGLYSLVGVLFVLTSTPSLTNNRNIRETVKTIQQLHDSNTQIFICPDWLELNFIYYYDRNCFSDFNVVDIKKNIYRKLHSDQIFPVANKSQVSKRLNPETKRILFLDDAADYHYPHNDIFEYLKAKAKPVKTIDLGNNLVLREFQTY